MKWHALAFWQYDGQQYVFNLFDTFLLIGACFDADRAKTLRAKMSWSLFSWLTLCPQFFSLHLSVTPLHQRNATQSLTWHIGSSSTKAPACSLLNKTYHQLSQTFGVLHLGPEHHIRFENRLVYLLKVTHSTRERYYLHQFREQLIEIGTLFTAHLTAAVEKHWSNATWVKAAWKIRCHGFSLTKPGNTLPFIHKSNNFFLSGF